MFKWPAILLCCLLLASQGRSQDTAFLLLYDAVNYTIHHKHARQLDQRAGNLQLSFAPGNISMVYSF
ncbi:hypothetical protein [Chitinophaga vietnamensis]|uniref:hypothetical protein n=1 Tax=Chitinophaga vietnamensis TaxID=2593957 RepID=UPI0011779AA1|nr:hypothetical protein [Chitinophaga vietnamensis]